jgi:hypothetical protein
MAIFFGLPFAAGGLWVMGSVLQVMATALMGGLYLAQPAELARHLFVLVVGYAFLGVGLLMSAGGIYCRVNEDTGQITAIHFYGLFGWVRRCRFDEVVQVVQYTVSSLPTAAHMRQTDGRSRYYSSFKLELELQDGRRMAIGSHGDKAKATEQAERLAAQLQVPVRNLGLLKRSYHKTKV